MIVLGLVLVIFYIVSSVQFKELEKNSIETKAVITKVSYRRNKKGGNIYQIQYIIDDKEYSQNLSTSTTISYSPGVGTNMNVGDTVSIYYSPEDPMKIATRESLRVGFICLIMGIVSIVFSVTILIVIIKNNKMQTS